MTKVDPHAAYVAFSRVKKLCGILCMRELTEIDFAKFKPEEAVKLEDQRLSAMYLETKSRMEAAANGALASKTMSVEHAHSLVADL